MKLNKSPRTDQHPSCTGSVLQASKILLQSTESAGQKEMPCKNSFKHLFKLFIYLSHIYSNHLYTFLTFIQAIYIPFKQFTQIIHTSK